VSAVFVDACRPDTFALAANPVAGTDKRREPPPAALDFFEPDEVELRRRRGWRRRAGRDGLTWPHFATVSDRGADDTSSEE